MYSFLIVLLIIDAVVLAAAVLLQAGKGGGLAASFGGASSSADSLIGTRQAGNILTKTSWWAGGIFILLAFVLQVMSTRSSAPTSILDQVSSPAPATAPATGTQSTVPLQPVPTPEATPASPATTPPKP